jgi:hypothetical protein
LVYDAERDGRPANEQPAPAIDRTRETRLHGVMRPTPCRVPRDTSQLLISSLALVLALMVASWGADVIRANQRMSTLDVVPLCEIAVGPDDSLWSIAETHPVEGVSTPELVAWLRETNGLESSALALGETLCVPCNDLKPLPSA